MYVGMNNYEYYTPEYCDGNFCCRDCERCPKAEKMMEKQEARFGTETN